MRKLFKELPIPYWLCVLIGIGLGIILGTRFYWTFLLYGEAEKFDLDRYFMAPFVNQTLWGLLIPLVYYCFKKFPIKRISDIPAWSKLVLASVVVAGFHETMSYVLWWIPMDLLGIHEVSMGTIKKALYSWPAGFIGQWLEFWIIYLLFAGYDYAIKYQDKELEIAQMESQLSNAQLQALRLQLQPHFLFNTLNTISSLAEINASDAQKIISKLGNLLRGLLTKDQKPTITLSEEIDFIKDYLDIEEVRFQDRLKVYYDIDPLSLQAEIPSFILQPLVENAIKHGIAPKIEPGVINIHAQINAEEQRLLLKVIDDGGKAISLDNRTGQSPGIGLKNVYDRLKLLYQDQFTMHSYKKEDGYEVTLDIPLKYKS